jgi:hypothetical protein
VIANLVERKKQVRFKKREENKTTDFPRNIRLS